MRLELAPRQMFVQGLDKEWKVFTTSSKAAKGGVMVGKGRLE